MLINAKKIIGLPIIDSVTGIKTAFVSDILVDPDGGSVLAFLIKKHFFWEKSMVVSFRDVVEFYADGLLVRDADSVIDAIEVLKAKEVLDKKIRLIGSRVLTMNGQKLGILYDFLFDTEPQKVMTLVVKKRFSPERRIISAERVLSILPGKVIIRDAIIKAEVTKRLKALGRLLGSVQSPGV